MARKILIGAQVLAAALFAWSVDLRGDQPWIAWAVPLALILLIVVNSIRFTRLAAWVIFGGSFFCFLVLLSAFTLRWRLEPGFEAWPFYRAMLMYVTFVYISLGQIKLLGGGSRPREAGPHP